MNYSIDAYVKFLDNVMVECGQVSCLTPSSNAVTRRAKATFTEERKALVSLAATHNITEVSSEIYDEVWEKKLCKSNKYGLLTAEYAKPRDFKSDSRWPQDGRVVPGYAKDVLSQLRTMAACVTAAIQEKSALPA